MAAVVRPARTTDAEQVAAVHVASWQWAYAGLLPAEELAGLSVADRADRWRAMLAGTGIGRTDRGATFVADLDGRVVGFVAVGPGRDDVGGPSVGELYALYLQREVAGSGTGALRLAGRRRHEDRAAPDLVDLDEVRYERILVPATAAGARGTLPS